MIFVAVFTTFLTQCVDYSKVPHSTKMSQILIESCTSKISGFSSFAIWLFSLYVIWKSFEYVIDIRRLFRMRDFFVHLLEIPDSDMQTVTWQTVVAKLMALRDSNPITAAPEKLPARLRNFLGSQSKQRLDAHDIANRLMRKENYLIAMFNKETLDLTLPIPLLGDRQLFSRTLEWNLHFCVLDFLFNENGQIRQLFLKTSHRRQLSTALKHRFMFAAFMNVMCAPVIVLYMFILYFFKYFNVGYSHSLT
jgi:autophagy-related protein 9